MYDAVIFDLDGTLIDSVPDIHDCANKALSQHNLPQISLERARGYVGNGVAAFVARYLEDEGENADLHGNVVASFLEHYLTATDHTTIYPGVEGCLAAFKQAGIQLGLCTNKPIAPTRNVLAHFGWDDMFEVVLGGDSLPQRKPDPTPLHKCVEKLGATRPLYVGDSEVDAATAEAAKVPFALYTEGYRKSPVLSLPHDLRFSDFDLLRSSVLKG